MIYFTFELVLRLLACPQLVPFLLSFMTIVDIVAVLPYYILLAVGTSSNAVVAVRILRLFRVFRILKFGRYSSGLQVRMHLFLSVYFCMYEGV